MLTDNAESCSCSPVEKAEQRLDELMQKCSILSNVVEKLKSIREQKSPDWRSLYLNQDQLSTISNWLVILRIK